MELDVKVNFQTVEEKTISITLREATEAEAPIAFKVHCIQREHKNKEIRTFDGKLWRTEDGKTVEDLKKEFEEMELYGPLSRKMSFIKETVDNRLLVDGVLYSATGEPYYAMHDHGVLIDFTNWRYRDEPHFRHYYNASQRSEALSALNRDGFDGERELEDNRIEVMIPEEVEIPEGVPCLYPGYDSEWYADDCLKVWPFEKAPEMFRSFGNGDETTIVLGRRYLQETYPDWHKSLMEKMGKVTLHKILVDDYKVLLYIIK